MKKKILCMLALMAMTMITACGKNEEALEGAPVEVESDEGEVSAYMGNPWTESDAQGVFDATGISIEAPADATDVYYNYMEQDKMAQVQYTLDGAEWTYRAQPTASLEDISGAYFTWTNTEAGKVNDLDASYLTYLEPASDDPDSAETNYSVMVVNWYDAAKGITYSLSAQAPELNGMDIQAAAEAVYVPMQ